MMTPRYDYNIKEELFKTLEDEFTYTWWVVLIIGFVIFTWVSTVSGTIIMVGFILILMAF